MTASLAFEILAVAFGIEGLLIAGLGIQIYFLWASNRELWKVVRGGK